MDTKPILGTIEWIIERSGSRTPLLSRRLQELAAKLSVADAHGFIFPEAPAQVHVDFGIQLLRHQAFRLPYTSCIYQYPAPTETGARRCYICLDQHYQNGALSWNAVVFYQLPTTDLRATLHLAAVFDLVDIVDDTNPDEPRLGVGILAATAPPDTPPECQRSAAHQRVAHEAGQFLGLTASLLSREVRQTSKPIASGLNRARERKGLPPLIDHVFITVAPTVAGGAKIDERNGSRRSPETHWRRGHVRRLADGQIVPVVPTIVNAGDEAFLKRDYIIKIRPKG